MKTKTKKHTPTPWRKDRGSIKATFMGEDVQVALMGRTNWCGNLTEAEQKISKAFRDCEEADVSLIVKAVNNHERLLRACKEALEYRKQTHYGNDKCIGILVDAIIMAEGK